MCVCVCLRCQDAEAFELSSSGLTNGVFVKFLKRRLLDDEKITVVLDKVAEGMFGPTCFFLVSTTSSSCLCEHGRHPEC